jgi:hypothetical protein
MVPLEGSFEESIKNRRITTSSMCLERSIEISMLWRQSLKQLQQERGIKYLS